jgi:hypothetical protein
MPYLLIYESEESGCEVMETHGESSIGVIQAGVRKAKSGSQNLRIMDDDGEVHTIQEFARANDLAVWTPAPRRSGSTE